MLRAGDSVGRYLIERRLEHGGVGTLCLAHDPLLDRNIALTLLLGDIDLPGAHKRFVREDRAAAALGNPNIVTIYDAVAAGQQLDGNFRPSAVAFSPRFIDFFLAGPQAPR
jgi:serine/threonine protein kinase